ncbi:tRNA-dependent cyclodipeptide synthase [Streptomyces sp. A012304]|uniref:tRNA-dependent cyclodipeptide synthase n=1 Tax=Streptomyces sp. A012304 TaxID=375446 RepID=UPI00222E15D2|nr:tRNA-dependent cyclodipeptide synthase [Streptomyces sp. A012304]GKQ38467.1 cyclo(L-leucyl-L-leucyl) synthase [Streptomyces sp. A012304]
MTTPPRCREILDRGEHVLIGISLRNSYFSEERITELLRWSSDVFRRIDVIIPDAADVETWLALGYSDAQAWKKTRSTASRIRNRVARARVAAGVPAERFRQFMLSEFTSRSDYQSAMRRCEEGIACDSALRALFLRPAGQALRPHLCSSEPTPAQAEMAMRYFIAEMPMLLDARGLLETESTTIVYHRRLDYLDRIISGETPLRMCRKQAFVVVRPRLTGIEV